MPARTQAGAVIVAMLEAYRRTLEKTMAQARSMGQVVEESAIPLIEDPDDAVVWGMALGLQEDVEEVLQRSAEDFSPGGRAADTSRSGTRAGPAHGATAAAAAAGRRG